MVEQVPLKCPPSGVVCDGGKQTYAGGVWHDPQVAMPNCTEAESTGEEVCTEIYLCVLNGCPDKGSTEMECKIGYNNQGPLCSICSEHYFKHNRDCIRCAQPRWSLFVSVLLMTVVLFATAYFFFQKYNRLLRKTVIFAHVKILVSFFTVVMTVATQFDVQWPDSFVETLNAMAFLTFGE
jgi:hypothetical protein